MAAIVRSTYSVSPTRPYTSIIIPYLAVAAITAGRMVKVSGTGVTPSVTNDTVGKGMALNSAAIGEAVDVLVFGPVEGFDLSSQTVGGTVYAVNTGTLDDAAGLYKCAVVEPSQVSPSGKILFVNCVGAAMGL